MTEKSAVTSITWLLLFKKEQASDAFEVFSETRMLESFIVLASPNLLILLLMDQPSINKSRRKANQKNDRRSSYLMFQYNLYLALALLCLWLHMSKCKICPVLNASYNNTKKNWRGINLNSLTPGAKWTQHAHAFPAVDEGLQVLTALLICHWKNPLVWHFLLRFFFPHYISSNIWLHNQVFALTINRLKYMKNLVFHSPFQLLTS